MRDKKTLTAVLVVLAVIVIAVAAWYYAFRYRTILVAGAADGGTVALACQAGQRAVVVTARYTAPSASAANVAAQLQSVIDAARGASFVVSGPALGQPEGGTLTFRYRCAGAPTPPKANFVPTLAPLCGAGEPAFAGDGEPSDATRRNAAGTVAWVPFSTQSRVSLERSAETPEAAESLNPVTGLGKTSSLRAMSDRYRRNEALRRLSIYELQPGQPGFMEEVTPSIGPRRSPYSFAAPGCALAGTEADAEFCTDGLYR
jgi:hypothetical protein